MSDNPYQSPEESGDVAPKRAFLSLWIRIGLYAAAILLIVAMLFPARRSARESARRNACFNNLKQISLALLNYHETHGKLPPAYTIDVDGNPLHSWRTLLLPYLGHQQLYESIDLTKPWDDSSNAAARETTVDAFFCPSSPDEYCLTTYFAVTGEETAFPATRQIKLSDIKDRNEETILIVDHPNNDRAVHWMAPQDVSLEEFVSPCGEEGRWRHPGVMLCVFADGHPQALSIEIDRQKLRSMLTIAGEESIDNE